MPRIYDIKVKLENNQWIKARDYQYEAFKTFKYSLPDQQNVECEKQIYYDKGGYKFTVTRLNDKKINGIYLIRENGTLLPICDWNNVKIFNLNKDVVEWNDANEYQKWIYFDFIYCKDKERIYACTRNKNTKGIVSLPFDLPAGLKINVTRDDDNIFIENEDNTQKLFISDDEKSRQKYTNSYYHMKEAMGDEVD